MFGKLLTKFMTTVVTEKKITRTVYYHPDTLSEIRKYCADNNIALKQGDGEHSDLIKIKPLTVSSGVGCDVCSTTIAVTETEFFVRDKVIPIPDKIVKMTPIEKVDTSFFHEFPIEKSTDILVMSEQPNYRFTAVYGSDPDNRGYRLSHHDIRSHIGDLIDKSGTDQSTVAQASYSDMALTSVIYDDWDFLIARTSSGLTISISIPNERPEKDYSEDEILSVTTACIFARAILLTMLKTEWDISCYNEHDLRSAILALLLVDRM